jgi:carboxymethylenebutenolidase
LDLTGGTMTYLIPLLLLVISCSAVAAEIEEVTFPSGKLELHGFIYKPEGTGTFPAILYNHGSERKPGRKTALGELFARKGYIFFVPHRSGHGRSPYDVFVDSYYGQGRSGVIPLQQRHLKDQLAALYYLKALPYVDRDRIGVAGCSYGGIQTILAVEANTKMKLGLRAAIDFAGAAQAWDRGLALRRMMLGAVRKATIPILLIQAENDYDLRPSRALAKELENLGKPHKLVIFPPYGDTPQEGHGGFCYRGGDVWGREVFSFLDSYTQK